MWQVQIDTTVCSEYLSFQNHILVNYFIQNGKVLI